MQSISEIYARIDSEYSLLQNQYIAEEKAWLNELYTVHPEIAALDTELSSLAVKSAKAIIEGKFSEKDAADFVKKEAARIKSERLSLISNLGIEEYSPKYQCPKCKDKGILSNGEKCGCYMQKLRVHLAFPGEKTKNLALSLSGFDKFDLSYYPNNIDADLGVSPRKIMRAVFSRCTKFANSFSGEGSGNLLLCGPSGLGKTLMASSIANAVADRGYLSIYKSSYKLFQFMEDYKFSKIDREAYSATNDALYDCDLLVIDDFGTEFITSYTQSAFFDLLSTRLDSGKSTVISTNLPLEKIAEVYQERVMSRLKNEFEVLRFAGEDIRAIKNNK